ncbi:glycosyltransferase [Streptomyces sp. NBC_00101]|uniref:glycosyltransferase n=1 Tax=Streptomyces sp. NBC_00101 TaxID=2975651 RepID=UPI003253F055
MKRRVTGLVVAIPAHDEAEDLPEALRAVRAADAHARRRLAGVPPLTLMVAADACSDATAAVARREGAEVVVTGHRSAGAARAEAVARGLRKADTPAAHTWIATTDADSRVPADWLAHQLTCARDGWDCVLGTVRLAPPRSLDESVVRDLHRAHYFAERPAGTGRDWEHPHVHGANFGVAAAAYLRAGGFPAVPHGEDHALARALADGGARVLRTNACAVETSGRLTPRAPHGFGAFLHALRTGAALAGDAVGEPVRPGGG